MKALTEDQQNWYHDVRTAMDRQIPSAMINFITEATGIPRDEVIRGSWYHTYDVLKEHGHDPWVILAGIKLTLEVNR